MFFKTKALLVTVPILLVIFLLAFGSNAQAAVWSGPLSLPPYGNVDKPLNVGTSFAGQISGTWDNLNLAVRNCTSSEVLTKDNNVVKCTSISGAQSDSNLLQVLRNGGDASNFTGGVIIGGGETAWMNLGGAFTAGWVHAVGLGNNSFIGNVGIGTTSPQYKLDVQSDDWGYAINAQSSANNTIFQLNNTSVSGRAWWLLSGSNFGSTQGGKFAIYDRTANAFRLVIDSAGNFGIGTDAPSAKLEVNGGMIATGVVVNGGLTTTGNIGIGTTNPAVKLQVNGKAQFGTRESDIGVINKGISVNNPSNTDTSLSLRQYAQSLGQIGFPAGDSTLHISNTRLSNNELISGEASIVLTENGDVGIGTATPSQKLTVNGQILTYGINPIIYMQRTDDTNGLGLVTKSASGNQIWQFLSKGTGDNNNMELYRVNGSGNFVIPNSNVGIGNTSPANRLDVTGDINVTGQIKTNGVAGLTKTITVKGSAGNNCNLIVTNGLIASTTCP